MMKRLLVAGVAALALSACNSGTNNTTAAAEPVAAVAPKLTAVAPVKLVPVIVTLVPPVAGPLVGETDVTVGGETGAI